MRKTITANSDKTLLAALREMQEAYESANYINIHIDTGRQRTDQQRKAIEVFCKMLADTLNDAGFDMQAVFAVKELPVPWSQETVKDILFKPIAKALFSVNSTVNLERGDCGRVHEVLCRQLATSLGVTCPEWPSKDSRDA